jgi:hypothetical protein
LIFDWRYQFRMGGRRGATSSIESDKLWKYLLRETSSNSLGSG